MYLKNYRPCPYPAAQSSRSQEIVYSRCHQREPEVRIQSPRSQSLPRVTDQKQQGKHIPHHKSSSGESGKEQKENCSGSDSVKAAKNKVHHSHRKNKEQPAHRAKKLAPPEKTAVKSCSDSSHKNHESSTAKPARDSKQETSQLLIRKVVSKDSSILPSSSLSIKISGVARASGGFTVLRNDSLARAIVLNGKPTEPRSSEPPLKRKKTAQKAISTIPGTTVQHSTGKGRQNLDHGGKKAPCRPVSSDDAISDDDIFREIPERYLDRTSKMKEKTVPKCKEKQLLLNGAAAAASKDKVHTGRMVNWKGCGGANQRQCDSDLNSQPKRGDVKVGNQHCLGNGSPPHHHQKKYSHKNSGHIKEVSCHHSGNLGAPPTGCKVSQAGKDTLAKERSRSNAISEKDRPKNERHKDPRSALILAKRDKLMKAYRLDCETFAMVAKQLVSQDPTIEKRVHSALRKSLQLIGRQCLEKLKKSIAKYDAANAVTKSN